MATFCQFCDKEMMFEKQATMVDDYITCGSVSCQHKAKELVKDIVDDKKRLDLPKQAICIFSTLTCEDDTSWKLIHESKHPPFLNDTEIMGHMIKGGIVTIECEDGEVSYRAKTAKEAHGDIAQYFKEAS